MPYEYERARARGIRLALLMALGMPAGAMALTDEGWRCLPDGEGGWACEQVDMQVGPFEPPPKAPVYKRPDALSLRERERREADPDRPRAGQSVEQARLTWVPRNALDTQTQQQLPPWCPGTYVERDWTEAELALDSSAAPIELQANLVDYLLGNEGTLGEQVTVSQGARRVSAEQALFDEVEQVLSLEGNVRLAEPGILLRGDAARYDLGSGRAELDGAQFVLYEGGYRGSAAQLSRADGVISVQDAQFTRCQPGNDGWKLVAGHIEIPEDADYGTARNTRVEVGGVPVFWTPYLSFPTSMERKSGFLSPAVGYADQDGFDVALPYYFNLAPNYDATVTPRLMTERGLLVEGEMRHVLANTRNSLGGAYMHQDDNYDGRSSFDEFEDRVLNGLEPNGEFQAAERWLITGQHEGRWMEGLTSSIEYVGASDRDYFRDLGTDLGVSARTEMERTAELAYRKGGLDVRLWAQDIFLLEDELPDAYTRLPQLDVGYSRRLQGLPLVLGVQAHHAQFQRDDALAPGMAGIDGGRTHIVPRVTLPLEWSYAFLRASAAYQYTSYDLDDVPLGVDENPDRSLPTASVDAGLIFEKDLNLFGQPTLQTVEPRLYYLYIEEEDQSALPIFDTADLTYGQAQLFRENRFAGVDRIGDANQLTTALTTRFLSAQDGSEMLSATVGRINYFEDRAVNLTGAAPETANASGWLTELVLRLGGGLDARALWVWDAETDRDEQRTLDIRYRPSGRQMVNLRYRSRGETIEQVDASLLWPLTSNYSLIARYYYDLENEEVIESFGGLQYDDCCWRVRVIGRQYRRFFSGVDDTDAVSGIFIDVVMKGLTGFGTGVDDIMEDGILGYREQDFDAMPL